MTKWNQVIKFHPVLVPEKSIESINKEVSHIVNGLGREGTISMPTIAEVAMEQSAEEEGPIIHIEDQSNNLLKITQGINREI